MVKGGLEGGGGAGGWVGGGVEEKRRLVGDERPRSRSKEPLGAQQGNWVNVDL